MNEKEKIKNAYKLWFTIGWIVVIFKPLID